MGSAAVDQERPSSLLGQEEYERLRRYYNMDRLVRQHIEAYSSVGRSLCA
jgi:hypothetical protein